LAIEENFPDAKELFWISTYQWYYIILLCDLWLLS